MKETLAKTYNPAAIEQPLYERWEQGGHFKPAGGDTPYCIMIPPANVTGSLHMGHAFQDTIMDALTRYHRMRGENTLWQAGVDHAGIATQMVVERQLEAEGTDRRSLGREAFVQRVWAWKEQSAGTITEQLRRLGASLDWTRERFTMDEGLSQAVREVFVRLHDEGLIYRGKRLVNWDPVLLTAISDLEVQAREEAGHLWHMRYPLVEGVGYVTVATTRPETMLGDAAVAVHPDDARYSALVGKTVRLPLVDRQIPVIADEYVDPQFGSGCLKITPAHDFNDYEVGQRHGLPLINIFSPDAHVDLPDTPYHGLDRYAARERIVADLEAADLLEKIEDHTSMVPRGDRSHAVIEPFLTDQWFVRIEPLAEAAIAAVEDGRIRFVPEHWARTYFEWMRNIQDWCISRQLWWGHRIPAWYDKDGRIYVGASEQAVRQRHDLGDQELRQDEDVLDTWFSSALWPFSTLGWPEKTDALKSFYPTSVLVTGFDIIFFWVARMIMMGLKFTGDVPFREVYIHGLIRDGHGQKMSKSKGNVLDPLDLIEGIGLEALVQKRTSGLMRPELAPEIEKHTREEFPDGIPAFGTDALRFTFANLATQGRHINFDLGRIEGHRNFCNKLWNAARFVLMNTRGEDCGADGKDVDLSMPDRWIIARLQQTEAEVEAAFASYRFDLAAQAIYHFTWDEYCSWYLELSKIELNSATASAGARRGTRRTLVRVLEALLRLTHPIMPFVTETLWQEIAPIAGVQGETIMRQPYPHSRPEQIDEAALADMHWLMALISAVRNIRGEMNIEPARRVDLLLDGGDDTDRRRLASTRTCIQALARTGEIGWLDGQSPPEAATALVGELKIHVPLGALINTAAEMARIERERSQKRRDLQRTQAKLANPDFLDRAPEAIVEKERMREGELKTTLANLDEHFERIAGLAKATN